MPRRIASTIVEAMAEARVVALLGPRQAGKSTLAWMLAAGPLPAEYITLDDERARALAAEDPQGFIDGFGRRTVIDEIQRVPELLLAIKARVDRDWSPGQFLITGSANLRRLPTVADALPGRVDYLTMWPFTQGEIAEEGDGFLDRLFAGELPTSRATPAGRGEYAEIMLAGGYPEAYRRSPSARRRFFESYVDSIIDRDIPETSRVHDPASLGSLLRLLAARSGSLVRYDALARESGLDGKTVKSHIAVLERLFLVRVRRPWHVNLSPRQVKTPKLYLTDPGMLAALLGANTRRVSRDDAFAGAIFETFVATELERQVSFARDPLSLWHFRQEEREVDVIAERASGEIVGIEVKAGSTVRPRDFKGLAHLRDRIGARLLAGVVLYAGEQALPFGERLWALPLNSLWTSGPE
ncbi:MAG: ATP-binding protein [Solirubrobacterales bacterium]|nr:ATP-binding protein [Solirubrobacterales bacterium]